MKWYVLGRANVMRGPLFASVFVTLLCPVDGSFSTLATTPL
jgi:hypothetical protein